MNIDPNNPGLGEMIGLPSGLQPPSANAQEGTYNIRGVPVGEGAPSAAAAGAAQTDTISSLGDHPSAITQSFMSQFMNKYGTQLDATNPNNPVLPVNTSLLNSVKQALLSGKVVAGTARSIQSQELDTSQAVKKSGGNPWLAANVMVAFLISFMDLVFSQKAAQAAAGKVQINQMNAVVSIAKDQASEIMATAQIEMITDYTAAAASAVSLVMSVASFAGSAGALGSMAKVNSEEGVGMTSSAPKINPQVKTLDEADEDTPVEDNYEEPAGGVPPRPIREPDEPAPQREDGPSGAARTARNKAKQAKFQRENTEYENRTDVKAKQEHDEKVAHNKKVEERFRAKQQDYDSRLDRADKRNRMANMKIQQYAALNGIAQALQGFATNFVQGTTALMKAQKEGVLKALEAQSKIASDQMDKASQWKEADIQTIDQATQALMKIADSIAQAQEGALRVSS